MKFEEQEKRLQIFRRAGWKCECCGQRLSRDGMHPQLAHIIPQKKRNIKKYGKQVIHHQLNLKAVCSGRCNSAVDINGKDMLIEKLVNKIQDNIDSNKK